MNESINNQQAQVLGIEPNIQALLRDDDEGSGLWRSRTRGQKRTFKRRQLLATVSTHFSKQFSLQGTPALCSFLTAQTFS